MIYRLSYSEIPKDVRDALGYKFSAEVSKTEGEDVFITNVFKRVEGARVPVWPQISQPEG